METIDTEVAEELALGYDCDDCKYVDSQFVSEHRWYSQYLIVFKQGDELYGLYYDQPATEMQEGQDTFDGDPVSVFPVTAEEVTVTKYAPTK